MRGKELSISIIILCRNEEKLIGMCLDSIIDQDYQKDKMKIGVVDGMREYGIKGIVVDYEKIISGEFR